MQRKDLALRVLSTAAIMSIVTSIAAPAFADVYYIGNGSIDVETITSTDGKQQYVKVTQGNKTYTDTSDEIVIKDGTSEKNTTQIEESRIDGKKANVAVPDNERTDTQEPEAAGSADAAGESQPDPDAGFTLNETGEDSAQTQEGKDTTKKDEDTTEPSTDNPTENPKKDVVYEYAPADPEPEQQATKPTLSAPEEPEAKTPETTLADAPATTAPAEGSAKKTTTNVIRVINNWVDDATKELKIRLSNVNIKVEKKVNKAAMDVSGSGRTKIELDGQNVLDSSGTDYPARYQAGLRKQGEGTLIITDETNDEGKKITTPKSESDTSGRLTAKGVGGNGAAGIGGSAAEGTKNITIEGYATVDAIGGGWGAGIGGGGYYGAKKPGDAENIIIQGYATVHASGNAGIGGGYAGNAKNIIIRGHSKVTASGATAIGGGSAGWDGYYGGSAKGIVICDHATVVANSGGYGAAIGAAGENGTDTEAEVTIGTAGATAEQEDVHVTASGFTGSAIGSGTKDTKVTIQGHSTIRMESRRENSAAIGSKDGDVEVNIKDNVTIDAKDEGTQIRYEGGGSGIGGGDIRGDSNRKVVVNIDGGTNGKVKIGDYIEIFGEYGAISGTEVNIGDNVLLKMKPWGPPDDKYINVKGAEAAVGTRNNPAAGGLVNTIGDNTELWYYKRGVQHKIVHGKNVCTKNEIDRKDATCTEDGWVKYGCTYESDRHATAPEHIDEWTETIPALGHDWKDNGDANHICDRDHVTAAHTYGEWTTVKEATCTAAGQKQHTCTECGHVETQEIPATGHHWKDNGDGTHTCPDCGATEGQPFNTNSALELRVVDAEGMDQPFTVSQNGTLRTYTGAYDTATLTGDLDTLRYLQDHGAQTIQFVTNGQTSSFAINDLLAQGSGSEVFYLTHRGAEEPTLLLVEADHSELVKD